MSNQFNKVVSAAFYGVSSLAVIFVNKVVLTTYDFKYFEFLALCQFLSTCVVLGFLSIQQKIEISHMTSEVFWEVAPVSLMFLGNVVFGLGGTRSTSLPMFTALRRFSIMMTMIGEYYVIGKSPTNNVMLCVFLMVGGALVAASNDLSFDLYGYALVFLNNFFTALSGVYLKKASTSGKCSKMSVLFYNSLFSALILMAYFFSELLIVDVLGPSEAQSSGLRGAEVPEKIPASQGSILMSIAAFPNWAKSDFVVSFFLATIMGSVLNYSIFLCTNANSALTTSVIGCLKNVLTTYVAMLTMSDYTFSAVNFIGINISILGSLIYTYVTMYIGEK